MHRTILSLALCGFLACSTQAQKYFLQSAFQGGPTFLDNFDFWTSWDPTFGYVHYIDRATAEQYHMINTSDASVAFGVETTQMLDPNANIGRPSVRLTTLQSWTHGLFIIDLKHMPTPRCGSWPALWTLGGTGVWPGSGEIDIIEYVSKGPSNLIAMHTTPGCTIAGSDQSGRLLTNDCGAGNGVTGCTVATNEQHDAANHFNAHDGGVYAMEWTSTAIRVWSFPRSAIPESILAGQPDVNTFGMPTANFAGSCDIDAHFTNHSLIFDIDFCGQWAGPTFHDSGCPVLDPSNAWQSCNTFVALNPGAFKDTYWEVNYLNVYQTSAGALPPPAASSSSLSSVVPAISTTSVSTALSNAQGRTSTPTTSIDGSINISPTGTFTATSSVLSVLSSISASASSASASLVGRATSSSSVSLVSASSIDPGIIPPITSTPPMSGTTDTTLITSASITFSAVGEISTSDPIAPPPCTDSICTSYVQVTVVQTITVNAATLIATSARYQRQEHGLVRNIVRQQSQEGPNGSKPLNMTAVPHITTTSSALTIVATTDDSGRCSFLLPAGIQPETRWTKFLCTFTKHLIFDGTLATEHCTSTTSLGPNEPLVMSTWLNIDSFVLETGNTAAITSTQDLVLTGRFTQTSSFTSETTITAYPVIILPLKETPQTPTPSSSYVSVQPTATSDSNGFSRILQAAGILGPREAAREYTSISYSYDPYTSVTYSYNPTYASVSYSFDPLETPRFAARGFTPREPEEEYTSISYSYDPYTSVAYSYNPTYPSVSYSFDLFQPTPFTFDPPNQVRATETEGPSGPEKS